MKKAILLIPFILFFLSGSLQAQDDIQIGRPFNTQATTGALYDFSDPNSINIKVQLWGYVRFPGFYIVPVGVSLNELLSLGGGPTEDANLEDIRVVKIKEGSETVMQKYNYNDIVWEEKIKSKINFTRLDAGDIVVVPGEPRYFVREDVAFYLGVLTALASIAALVISIISITN